MTSDDIGNRVTQEKRALVTGASSGIGAAIVEKLLADGWNVLGFSRSKPDVVNARFEHVSVDLSSEVDLDAALAEIGRVDAIVHAAGKLRVGEIGNIDLADGRDMWRLHVETSIQLINTIAPRMADGSRIVLVGSRTARGSAARSQYAASKAAMVGLARSFAIELAPRGITVNVVSPGATDTPMLRDPARVSVKPKVPPIGRLVKPGEIAGLAAYLLSEPAASITGQEIVVCGGASL
ncbi:SDR family NAD(P)-dependent oxidoreductase [Tropicimonas isoalkanivorans]|uniref:NAD(P)-dependent dehydrogenase, short-chain alcohol dehydrogenase family n=1 Tax=Tropicimonas isoalkanivorans TaxID=441112 RepID=A0A1I1HPQ6_9RHOB|nr:SDR family oxidoreductase [Tropicimonas isoalkanivorans]SFC25836.1 NAD(P)-dependent dehydrogenase, short-chain alcohol dehydrogenase family [Tropicimonas isoalkanivorans]